MPDLVVVGAGMAGLVAAARARELGAQVLVHEKSSAAGGAMRLSSGMIWRHGELDRFREECPGGDERLQRLLFDRLDPAIRWLQALGARPQTTDTGNPITCGARFDPPALTSTLVAAAGSLRLGSPLTELPCSRPVILATGGFPASRKLLREHVTSEAEHVVLRTAPGTTGDGLRLGLEAGAGIGGSLSEIYGRNMPAAQRLPPGRFVELAQLYAGHAEVTNERGERFETATWSQIDVTQWTARQPRARAWFRVADSAMGKRVGDRSVREMVAGAATAGAPVRREGEATIVETVAGVTRTLGGLRIDEHARVAPGVFAAGDDAGGISSGGYASGLAAALVFGLLAAESALEV